MSKTAKFIQKFARPVTCTGLALSVAGGLAACAPQWPETGFTPTEAARAAPDPALLTGPQMQAALGPGGNPDALEEAEALAARADALRARGARLSRPVLNPGTRTTLQNAACDAAQNPAIETSPSAGDLCISR